VNRTPEFPTVLSSVFLVATAASMNQLAPAFARMRLRSAAVPHLFEVDLEESREMLHVQGASGGLVGHLGLKWKKIKLAFGQEGLLKLSYLIRGLEQSVCRRHELVQCIVGTGLSGLTLSVL
jgi:hypothetical protein